MWLSAPLLTRIKHEGCGEDVWLFFPSFGRQEGSEAAVSSLVRKLLNGECVEPLQKNAPEFVAVPDGKVKTRLQHKAASDNCNSAKLKPKQNHHRNFSLNN